MFALPYMFDFLPPKFTGLRQRRFAFLGRPASTRSGICDLF